MAEELPQRHIVVFDCNIYLDVAVIVGAPFTWEDFAAVAARLAKDPVPHPNDMANDSLRAIAMCTSGRFAGDETVEVWANSHIEQTVLDKAMQSSTPDPVTGYRGLGWAQGDADTLLTELIEGLAQASNGGTLGRTHVPDGNPPLDHEDGMVYGACRTLAGADPLAHVYCVTRDRQFIQARKDGLLSNHSRVITPSALVSVMRTSRTQQSMRRMFPRG